MTVLSVSCPCGQRLAVDPRHAGRTIRCRTCGRTLRVKGPARRLTALLWRVRGAPAAGWRGLARLVSRNVLAFRFFREARPGLRLAVVATWAWVLGVVTVAALMWTQGDSALAGTVILYSGRWIFLTPLLVLLPTAWVVARELVLPLALGTLVAAGPLMGLRLGWRAWWPAGDGMHLRVVTLNTAQSAPLARQLDTLLARWQPTVVAFQECGEDLALATRRVRGWFHHDTTGLCLLSRLPLQRVDVMDRSSLERVREDTLSRIGGAGFVVRYLLVTSGGPVALTNLHLETPRKGLEALGELDFQRLQLNGELREIESNRARHWVDGAPPPFLVAGDFNLPAESRIYRRHWSDLDDAFSMAGTGFGYTKYNGWIRIRIDHVLMSTGWRATRAVIGDDVGSDHRPLIVDLVRTRQR